MTEYDGAVMSVCGILAAAAALTAAFIHAGDHYVYLFSGGAIYFAAVLFRLRRGEIW